MFRKLLQHFLRKMREEDGFLQFIAPLISAALAAKSAFSKPKGSSLDGFQLPEFFEDPDYRQTQDYLKTLGIDILGGKVPDYYKAIGESGSPEFQKFLDLTNRDISQKVLEGAAISGRMRGGGVTSQLAQQISDNTTRLSFADYERALQGKEYLFGQGRGITESVREAGQKQGEIKNNFNLGRSRLDFQDRIAKDNQDVAEGTARGGALSSLVSTVFGTGSPKTQDAIGQGGLLGSILDSVFKGGIGDQKGATKNPTQTLKADNIGQILGKIFPMTGGLFQ